MRDLLMFIIGSLLIFFGLIITSFGYLLISLGVLLIMFVGIVPNEFVAIVGKHSKLGCIVSRFGMFLMILYALSWYIISPIVPAILYAGILLIFIGYIIGNIRLSSTSFALAGAFNGLSMASLISISALMLFKLTNYFDLLPMLLIILFFGLIVGLILSITATINPFTSSEIKLRKMYVTMTNVAIRLNKFVQIGIAPSSIIYSANIDSILFLGIIGQTSIIINHKRFQIKRELPENVILFLSRTLLNEFKETLASAVIPADVYSPSGRVIEGYEVIRKTFDILKGGITHIIFPFFEIFRSPHLEYMCIGPFIIVRTPLQKTFRLLPFIPSTMTIYAADGKIILKNSTIAITENKVIFRKHNALISLTPEKTYVRLPYHNPQILLSISPTGSWIRINSIRTRIKTPNYIEYIGLNNKLIIHRNKVMWNGHVFFSQTLSKELISSFNRLSSEIERTVVTEALKEFL